MKAAGTILTRMVWNKLRYYPFNLPLLWYQLTLLIVGKLYGKFPDLRWRDIWQAAQICHVRLCLGDFTTVWDIKFISFTAPEVKIETWRPDMVKGRFSYHDPTFTVSEAEQQAMNAYAEKIKGDPVARKYDYLQLLSYAVNLVCWIVYPPCWGREVIRWFNLPGGREVCSSGVTAELRWSKPDIRCHCHSPYFRDYSTSMVSPCLFWIDKNWRKE